jgi:hypothetical protein
MNGHLTACFLQSPAHIDEKSKAVTFAGQLVSSFCPTIVRAGIDKLLIARRLRVRAPAAAAAPPRRRSVERAAALWLRQRPVAAAGLRAAGVRIAFLALLALVVAHSSISFLVAVAALPTPGKPASSRNTVSRS